MGPEFSAGKKAVVVFTLGFAFLAAIGWVSYRSTVRLIQLGRDGNQAHQIFELLQDLFSQLQDAETGQRGFIITGDERYLETYVSALGALEQSLRELRQSSTNNPHIQGQIDTLEPLISRKLDELKLAVEIRRTKGLEAAINLVQTGQGKNNMDSIRQVMSEIKGEQAALVEERTLEMLSTAQRTTTVIIVGSLLSLLAVGLATIVIFRDLAHRQRVEDLLHESEEKFRTLFNSIDEGFCIIEVLFDESKKPVDYRLLETNPSFEKQTGIPNALGKRMREIAPHHEEHWFEIYGKIALTGEPARFENEAAQLQRWFDVYAFRIGKPELKNVAVIFNDITKRKLAEEELRSLNSELQQRTEDLTAVNQELEAFSYSVSHDLRAPLRSIDGFSQALLEDYHEKLDESGKDFLQRVRAAAQRMAQLIDDMIELSRVTRAEVRPETVNLSAIAKGMVEELQASEPRRRVEFSIAEDLVTQGDEHMLRVALENLIRNAWKFTSKRPTARIEVGAAGREDGRVVYFVRDDGAGFEMDHAQKLFSPFQRLHSMAEFKGTGVGLATVQRIVHRHGGRIWAEGQVNQGACFYFTL